MPFTTDTAEYDVLRSPNAGTKIDVGYLPQQDAPAKPAGADGGHEPVPKGYTLVPLDRLGHQLLRGELPVHRAGQRPIIKQLYFRQALEYLMNQAAVISGPLRGYGALTVGPVGDTPVTAFLSPKGKAGDPFPYNPAKARSLLASHGWKVVPDGVSTCADPAKCGPGIKKGTGLSFNLPYATGTSLDRRRR